MKNLDWLDTLMEVFMIVVYAVTSFIAAYDLTQDKNRAIYPGIIFLWILLGLHDVKRKLSKQESGKNNS